ncbi:prolipoprotein diacylglyceryl transferase [Synechococcus sp. UW140]|uniref:prolipoprotein diacylglyceryl transferase n=1 Tax=Synechococcus sp. UW140 TaxID=368503 RepID=UPI0025E1390B|nr:prolipoprotein diacylglyceryl transferase [Synechococcus sp. UW140]
MPLSILQSPGPLLVELGPLAIRWYGLLIAVAVLLGLWVSSQLAKMRGLDPSVISDLLPLIVFSAVIGARLYYVLFEWQQYQINWLEAFQIWKGGIAIHGALLGGSIAVIAYSRWMKLSFWGLMDVLLPSVALGQAIGRWGNFFNSEAFGLPTSLPWKLFIPVANRPAAYLNESWFHPTFLYESIWDLGLFVLLILLFRQRRTNGEWLLPKGGISCVYALGYSLGRFWIEGLRLDPLCLWGSLGEANCLRMAQLVSLILAIAGAAGLAWLLTFKRSLPDPGRPIS